MSRMTTIHQRDSERPNRASYGKRVFKKVIKFGGRTAGASITQIATFLTASILLRNTLLENAAFNIQLTLCITGSLAILDKAGRKHATATCQIQSRNPTNRGKVCNNVLGDFTHFASPSCTFIKSVVRMFRHMMTRKKWRNVYRYICTYIIQKI